MPKSYSDVPVGGRVRVEGTLGRSARGAVILDDMGAPLWALNVPADFALPLGGTIIVEGIRSGFDRIDVEWIGEPPLSS
ncbi:DUF5818 domain-containing protein [Sphingomonas sp. YL-JM2C]